MSSSPETPDARPPAPDAAPAAIVHALVARRLTLSAMESCTGGLLASALTDVEGASAVFPGGFVTYSDSAKLAAGVPEDVLLRHGVYSPECARAMAEAAARAFSTDIAIGVTGTAANADPAHPDAPVGRLFACILFHGIPYDVQLRADPAATTRHAIKRAYVDAILARLATLL